MPCPSPPHRSREVPWPNVFDPTRRLFDDPLIPRWCRDVSLRWWQQRQTSPGEEDARDPIALANHRNTGARAVRDILEGPAARLWESVGDPVGLAESLNVDTSFASEHVARGVVVAVVVHAYLTWVLAECRRRGVTRVFFVSREGATLTRAFNTLSRSLAADGRICATYVPASRLSTFLPSLDELSVESLARLWKQYPNQTFGQLVRNLSLARDEFGALGDRHGLTLDQPITDLAELREFFGDQQVRAAFARHRDAARGSLGRYLTGLGFFACGEIAMGDVGWKGSIQTNIEHAMRAWASTSGVAPPRVRGLYLALRRDEGLDTAPSTRDGFIADEPACGVRDWAGACVFRCGSMFEVALSAPHRCVVGYEPRAGTAHAELRPTLLPDGDPLFATLNAREREILVGPARLTRAACLRTLRVMATNARSRTVLDADRVRPWLIDLLRREIIYPTRASAESFLEHAHVETFGVFQPSRFDFVTPWRNVLRSSPIHWPHRMRLALEAHFWPDAIVRRSGVPLANFAFDMMLTRRARRA